MIAAAIMWLGIYIVFAIPLLLFVAAMFRLGGDCDE